jgi:hypothetical protein
MQTSPFRLLGGIVLQLSNGALTIILAPFRTLVYTYAAEPERGYLIANPSVIAAYQV